MESAKTNRGIMTNRLLKQSSWGWNLRLSAAAILLSGSMAAGFGIQILHAQASENLAHFDVVSVKPYKPRNSGRGGDLRDPVFLPGGSFISRAPLIMVIGAAYDVPFFGPTARISGGPGWIRSLDLVYDIEAKLGKDSPAGIEPSQRKQMLQALLADRFKLVVQRETKETPVYVLTVGKDGPKLPKADIEEKDCPDSAGATAADADKICHRFNGGRGRGLHARAADTSDLVKFVQNWADRPLIDETGLKGLFRFETGPWLPMDLDPSRTSVDGAETTSLPTLFTVFGRLGLKMTPQKQRLDSYVITRIEKPTEN
jgi:uncharacterized protein (TIGR03435 family)